MIRPMTAQLWAVVPAGGAGTRLWPLSRAGSPKFLHYLSGSGHSLLQDTHARLAPLVGERLLIVTGVAHQDAVRGQLGGLPADQVIAEPSPRDSMAAIGLVVFIERTPGRPGRRVSAIDRIAGIDGDTYRLVPVGLR